MRSRLLILALLVAGSLAPTSAWELPQTRVVGQERTVKTRSGESLYDIARREGYALEHLAEANDLPISLAAVGDGKSVLIPGRRILPDEAPTSGLVVNLPERGFYVFVEGEPARFFPIAIGQPGRFATPPGGYSVIEKVKNPQWIAPEWAGLGEDNVVEAGPDNPLGDRWIGLTHSGLGMHSTNNPSSIGSATSHGCMRMYPEVARTVFDLVSVGWPVRIEYVTSRVAVEKDGIFLAGFPDVYSRVDRTAELRRRFANLDILGFYDDHVCTGLMESSKGTPRMVVDLRPRVRVGEAEFPAALIQDRVWLENSSLEKLGVTTDYRFQDRTVKLVRGEHSLELPLYVGGESDRTEEQVFLSRGAAWFPTRDVLKGLSLPYQWDNKTQILRVDQP